MLIYLILAIIYPLINGEQTLNCGEWDAYKDQKCYKVFDNTYVQNYSGALNMCSQYEASNLLSLQSTEEQEFLNNLIYNVHQIVNDVWIGADYKNSSFHWYDNSTVNFTNWANGYPETGGFECVLISFSSHGKWMNEPCNKMNSVVCQKTQNWLVSYLQNTVMDLRIELDYYKSELKHVMTNASTGCSLSNVWVKCDTFVDFRTNKRQVIAIPKLLIEKLLARDDALSVCKKYNATLISVESFEKELFIENFAQSNTCLWTSGYNSADKKWRWINGHDLNYTKWRENQPDHGYPDEPCLEIYYYDKYNWNDISCTEICLVLCEFDVFI